MSEYQECFKACFLGDEGIGKSAFIRAILQSKFEDISDPFIAESETVKFSFEGLNYQVEVTEIVKMDEDLLKTMNQHEIIQIETKNR